mgnify:CR=1 FL=1
MTDSYAKLEGEKATSTPTESESGTSHAEESKSQHQIDSGSAKKDKKSSAKKDKISRKNLKKTGLRWQLSKIISAKKDKQLNLIDNGLKLTLMG